MSEYLSGIGRSVEDSQILCGIVCESTLENIAICVIFTFSEFLVYLFQYVQDFVCFSYDLFFLILWPNENMRS